MCIRDRREEQEEQREEHADDQRHRAVEGAGHHPDGALAQLCLLYTSDAADERSSVDLGGRRIIKKKKTRTNWRTL